MSDAGWTQILLLAALVVAVAPPLGGYIARVYGDEPGAPGDRFLRPVERRIYRLGGVDPDQEQRWTTYALSLLAFSAVSFVVLYGLARLQGHLPMNPTARGGVTPHLSFNTAVSFTTNTDWQSYSGETTMSHLTQLVGLTVQNFVSAAAGMAVMAALIRGLARRQATTIGNFWVDLTRTTTRILLPLSFLAAVVLAGQGVVAEPPRPRPLPRHWRGPPSTSREARSPARSPSSSWAATAADSSTPTPPIPTRIPPDCPTSSSCSAS